MPKVLPAIFSYEDMKAKWLQDNPEQPYTRRSDLETGRYALDKWLIRVDDEGKTLAVIGWKEHPQHTVTGGLLATKRGREIGGNTEALVAAREPQMPQNNPLVTSFKHRDGDNSRWIAGGKRAGWAFPDDTELFEQYSSLLPEDVKNDWLQAYPKTFGTKPINPEALSKEMYDGVEEFMLAKNERYIRELGESGFNVIDTKTNKRLNTIGLSKSQAKNMLELLKEGRSVWEYTKPRHSRWRSQLKKSVSNWADVLKVLPPSHYFNYAVPEKDSSHVNYPPKAYDYGTVRAIVRGHYLLGVAGNHGTSDTNTDEIEQWVECLKEKSQGRYWFYRKADENNYEIILADVYTIAGSRIAGTTKDFNRNMKNQKTEELITKLIVFTNYFKSMTLSQLQREYTNRTRVNCFYTGIKPNHPLGQAIQQRKKGPREPKPIVSSRPRPTPQRDNLTGSGSKGRGPRRRRNQQGRNKEAEFQRRRRRR